MTNRDNVGRFASTANPSSITPSQPFGYTKPFQHTNAATPPTPINLAEKFGRKGGPKLAKIPGGGPRPQGMVGDIKLNLAPPIKPEQQRPNQPESSEDPTGPVQPPFKPQEPAADPGLLAMPDDRRLAAPGAPSAVETMTPGSPIPPAVDGLLRNHGTPPSYGVVSLASKYTRPANPHTIIPGEVLPNE